MPANLTPAYYEAEDRFRSAETNEEKIAALEEMLSVMPKHKGTDGLRADLRRKLSQLKEAPAEKKAGARVDIFHVPRSGAGQVVLLGLPNTGKSSILAALTKAKVVVADFPFATQVPVPGMVKYEDIQIQLVDMPPITADYSAPGQVGTYRNGDIIAVVIDLSQDIEEQCLVLLDFLESRKLLADEKTPAVDAQGNILGKKAVCLCTKADLAPAGAFELARKSFDKPIEYLKLSIPDGRGTRQAGRIALSAAEHHPHLRQAARQAGGHGVALHAAGRHDGPGPGGGDPPRAGPEAKIRPHLGHRRLRRPKRPPHPRPPRQGHRRAALRVALGLWPWFVVCP